MCIRDRLWAGHCHIGASATNNQAEYAGAELGILAAGGIPDLRRFIVEGDSQLIVCQMRGDWQ
eukprot:3851984-Karenia_brevis.AAC.1